LHGMKLILETTTHEHNITRMQLSSIIQKEKHAQQKQADDLQQEEVLLLFESIHQKAGEFDLH
jgi:hypothetical protein